MLLTATATAELKRIRLVKTSFKIAVRTGFATGLVKDYKTLITVISDICVLLLLLPSGHTKIFKLLKLLKLLKLMKT